MSGLLNLEGLEGKAEDDILSANINEDVSVSVPGGLKEEPERNNGKEESIPVPASTTLTDKQYKDALSALQKSFKEGYEIMEALANATLIHEDIDKKQDEFVESAIEQAILEAYENGPIFEAVDRSDKDAVKKIVKNIRSKIKENLDKDKIYYRNVNVIATIIAGAVGGAIGGMVNGATTAGAAGAIISGVGGAIGGGAGASLKFWRTRLWQMIGVINIEDANIKTVIDDLNEKFKDELGEYKVLYVRAVPSLADQINNKFGWKNVKETYLLLVDKKLPKEIKDMQKEIDEAIKETEKSEKNDDKKED